MLTIRTTDNFYPNCNIKTGEPFKDETVEFTSESKAGKIRTVKLNGKLITATEESEE